jgi:hypothetical protein
MYLHLNWAGEYLFENSDVALLLNTIYPFGIQMTCLNGFFAHWDYYCLAEEMIRFGDRGAIGSFASSGLNYSWEHELLEHSIFDAAFNKGDMVTPSHIMADSKKLLPVNGD